MSCATISVPVDWVEPEGEQITLGLNRLPATDPQACLGSLIFNPGGPGGLATANLAQQAKHNLLWSPELRRHYNIIGLDPRGIGSSTPIKCDPSIWNERISLLPSSNAEFEALVNHNKRLGDSCRSLSGPIFEHVDTTSVARDLEAVRLALGGDKLNMIGFSYGTQIAAAYAELFPENVGRLVLDGNVDHFQTETSAMVTEAETYETEFVRFADWCASTTDCPLYGKDILQMFDQMMKNCTESPLSAPGCDDVQCRLYVTSEELRINLQTWLVYKTLPRPAAATWATLGFALAQAFEGNATLFSNGLATSQHDMFWQGLAVGCLDWFHASTSASDLLYKQQLADSIAPHTQGATQSYMYQAQCLGWPAPVQNPPHFANVRDTPPILMVNSLYDPEASYVWAEGLRAQIENSVLVARVGDGHTSYVLAGESQRIMDAFLINGTVPEKNTVVYS